MSDIENTFDDEGETKYFLPVNDISNNSTTETLTCSSLLFSDLPVSKIQRTKHSNKIFLPESYLYKFEKEKFPLYFKLTHPQLELQCICGVEEFTAPPDCVILPDRIMDKLAVEIYDKINVELINIEKGTYLKLQPHETSFIKLANPKAILEKHLSLDYPIISLDDTIHIFYNEKLYKLNVIECHPANHIEIVNCDINLDFERPIDMPPTPPPETSNVNTIIKNDIIENPSRNSQLENFKKNKHGFVPFSGKGYRLGSV